MKIIVTIVSLFLFNAKLQAQPHVQWTVSAERNGNGAVILVKGKIEKGWKLYASDKKMEIDGPVISWGEESLDSTKLQIMTPTVTNEDAVFGGKVPGYTNEILMQQGLHFADVPPALKGTIKAFVSDGKEFIPIEDKIAVSFGAIANEDPLKLPHVKLDHPVADCSTGGTPDTQNKSLGGIFLLGLLGGLIALITPCVFPMIPVTVSFFTQRSGSRKQGITNGFIYGGSILLIYLFASLPFHLVTGIDAQLFNTISTNVWVNIVFFLIFLFFAGSLFGFYQMQLPGTITNAAGKKSGIGSFIGIFFMALTLAIVSFSCTGPILGSLLVGSISGSNGAWQLTAGMAGFGLALGLPFGLFAIFPSMLERLPKSGSWLDAVKKVLAFIEVALALKFLSNADLVAHWGIFKREIFILSWIIVFFALAIFLFRKRNITGTVVGFISFAFAAYLMPGLTNTKFAKLNLLSGFAPPLSYSIYGSADARKKTVEPNFINNFDSAVLMSQKTGKPLLIDFTGWACVNCRKMEENVWSRPEIRERMENNFILVSLYVDDRKKLPLAERFTHKAGTTEEKEIVTVGDKYAVLEAENFKQATQPLYVILSPDGKLLNHPTGYCSATQYGAWLDCGTTANKK